MKFVMFFALIMTAVSARADLSGRWHGSGTWQDTGMLVDCQSMIFDLAQSESAFTVDGAQIHCQNISMQWKPVTFEVQNGQLLYQGSVVGSIGPDQMDLQITDSGSGMTFTYHVDVISGVMGFTNEIRNSAGELQALIRGELVQ